MPTLISISADGAGRLVGIDDEGEVWRGTEARSWRREYIDWKPVRSEFHELRDVPKRSHSQT
jgi:hypothetical protein